MDLYLKTIKPLPPVFMTGLPCTSYLCTVMKSWFLDIYVANNWILHYRPGFHDIGQTENRWFLASLVSTGFKSLFCWQRCMKRLNLASRSWIRRRLRWLLGENTDDRPEAGNRGVDVWCDLSVVTLCLQAHRFIPVDLPLWGSVSGCWCAFIRAYHWAGTGAQAFWLPAHRAVTASGGASR